MVDEKKKAIDYIIGRLVDGEQNLEILKRDASRKFEVDAIIKNPELLANFPKEKLTNKIKLLLLKKPTKTLSGVTPVAVMIRPQDSCKWGCIYCPFTGLAAKSYTGFEPAALRGRQFAFDPYLQAFNRVRQFEGGGHPADKCEVIVMGGTFLEMTSGYKTGFIKGIYDGLNGFKSGSLEEAIDKNELAKHRAIGLTIETRPDVCVQHIDEILSYGATRVELGVQHADDKMYKTMNRGHGVKEVVDSTRELKNAAFKVLYHIMPGLPGADKKKDIEHMKKMFEDERFRPDMLKIYPTLVIGGTVLNKWVESGKFEPYSSEEAADVISEFYRYIPKYVRVMRIQRDIPATKINTGVKKSNLRELVEAMMREKGIVPNEIRYREVGLQKANMAKNKDGQKNNKKNLKKIKAGDLEMHKLEYIASGGKEFFISYDTEENFIGGFIRLRFPKSSLRKEIDENTALIRELHVYGAEVPLDEIGKRVKVQHKGLGSKLLEETEQIARENGKEKMIIISGVGVREYYRAKGYERDGPYMSKRL
ncbi:tRNA uridine(34) 5-carboxymethylaminomethyl modification radical SAM/GNAT enzyme Elp3 [Candidatus Micrarchaeota archaeon]|nr:tRNA uridine(34) 5-carboxymethylaminomethyl modification radical SAM/GNAT enzyme Elp3 [Candidatus Micrarchaeota archaeon]